MKKLIVIFLLFPTLCFSEGLEDIVKMLKAKSASNGPPIGIVPPGIDTPRTRNIKARNNWLASATDKNDALTSLYIEEVVTQRSGIPAYRPNATADQQLSDTFGRTLNRALVQNEIQYRQNQRSKFKW